MTKKMIETKKEEVEVKKKEEVEVKKKGEVEVKKKGERKNLNL